ncbi:MAG: hypothetical protein OEN20_04995, partial [Gammaproteobacteria bacterium]|nr:hypothetical protein [Gammaproteobacteria bacterium]
MPGGYASPAEQYWRLVNHVALWDVTGQRVIEVRGKAARRFADYLTPSDLADLKRWWVPVWLLTDEDGGMLNDPILMCLVEDISWFTRYARMGTGGAHDA